MQAIFNGYSLILSNFLTIDLSFNPLNNSLKKSQKQLK